MKASVLAALGLLLVIAASEAAIPHKTMEMLRHRREILEDEADQCAEKLAAMSAEEREVVRRDIVNGDWSKMRSILSERALAEFDALPAEELNMMKKSLGKLVEKRGLEAFGDIRAAFKRDIQRK